MTFGLLVLASIVLVESFLFLDLAGQARTIARAARAAFRILGNDSIDDAVKESVARASARRIFGASGTFVLKLGLIVGIVGAAVAAVAAWSPAVGRELGSQLSSPLPLTALTLIAIGYGCMRGTIHR